MKYHVLIRWGGDPVFQVDSPTEADSPREAAAKRISKLANPLDYDDVLVVNLVGSGFMGSGYFDRAEIFSVREFIDDGKRRPKYGWQR